MKNFFRAFGDWIAAAFIAWRDIEKPEIFPELPQEEKYYRKAICIVFIVLAAALIWKYVLWSLVRPGII